MTLGSASRPRQGDNLDGLSRVDRIRENGENIERQDIEWLLDEVEKLTGRLWQENRWNAEMRHQLRTATNAVSPTPQAKGRCTTKTVLGTTNRPVSPARS